MTIKIFQEPCLNIADTQSGSEQVIHGPTKVEQDNQGSSTSQQLCTTCALIGLQVVAPPETGEIEWRMFDDGSVYINVAAKDNYVFVAVVNQANAILAWELHELGKDIGSSKQAVVETLFAEKLFRGKVMFRRSSEDLETLKLCQHFENIREDFDTMMESCIGGLYK